MKKASLNVRVFAVALLVFCFFHSARTHAQEEVKKEEVKKEKVLKNTVRFNITNPLLFGFKSLVFGYERTLGKHQSFSINIGQTSLPKILISSTSFSNSIVQGQRTTSDKGYNVSVDYRFYLSKENKYDAPHGVYIGPYYSYNFFERNNTWTLNSSTFQGEVSTDFRLMMNGLGGELGYQFILWKRVALDFVLFGPGVTAYSLKTSINTTLNADDQAELFKKINDALASKIPGYSLVIDDVDYERSGSVNTTTVGFRYMIHLGFRF